MQKLENYKIHKWTSEEIKQFWVYESLHSERFWGKNFGKSLTQIFKNEIKSAKKILDLGCGDGSLLKEIGSISNEKMVYGYENSKELISELRRNYRNTENITFLSNPKENEYDLIFCTEVIEHLYDKDLDNLIKVIKKIKSPNGHVIFTTPNNENLKNSFIYNPVNNKVFHRWQHVRSWDENKLQSYLNKHKFEEFKFKTDTLWHSGQGFLKNLYRKFNYRDLNLILKTR